MKSFSQSQVKQWIYTHKVVITCIVVVIILLIGWAIYHAQNRNGSPSRVTNFVAEFEENQEKDKVEEGMEEGIIIPGYSIIPIAAHTKSVSVDLENPKENKVHFQISFLLTDTGEKIYQSKLLSPGQHLYDITLERELEAADYNLTIQYDTFSTDEKYTPRNGATVNCILRASE